MRQLYETGKLVPTPSKSYDDRVILESAVRLDAAVVSNDHYRELTFLGSRRAIFSNLEFFRRSFEREARI